MQKHSEKSQRRQKGISTIMGIIIIVAVAVILFGGVFAYQYFVTKSQTPNIETTGPALSEVKGWKTYTNTQYGFSIQYPTDWQVSEKVPGVVPPKNGAYFSIFSNKRDSYDFSLYKITFSVEPTTLNNNELLTQTLKDLESNPNIKNRWQVSETNLLNVKNAVITTDIENTKCPMVDIETVNNNYLFKFDPICNINTDQTNILKTFKFIK